MNVKVAFRQFDEQAVQMTAALKTATHGELQELLGTVRGTIDRLCRLEQELTQSLEALEQI